MGEVDFERNRAEDVRTMERKNLDHCQRKQMENQKGVGNTKRLIIISTDMPQKRSGSCQRRCSFCKITFHLYLIYKESELISLPCAICFYLLKLSV